MDEQRPAYSHQISHDDWERTPASVKHLVEDMAQRLVKLEQQLAPVASSKPTAPRANQAHINQLIPGSLIRSAQCP